MSVCPVRGRGPTWAAVGTKKVLVGCDFFLAPIQPKWEPEALLRFVYGGISETSMYLSWKRRFESVLNEIGLMMFSQRCSPLCGSGDSIFKRPLNERSTTFDLFVSTWSHWCRPSIRLDFLYTQYTNLERSFTWWSYVIELFAMNGKRVT